MDFNHCLHCMNKTESYPCPHCGFDPETYPHPEYALRPGTLLHGKYVLGTILGQGGFGITYIGWDLVLGGRVAIKEFFPSGQAGRNPANGAVSWYCTPEAKASRNSGMALCLKEARKMSLLQNIPGVAHVMDVFQENDTAYIVMEYIPGRTLKAYVEKNGPLSWPQIQQIFLPALETMRQVHLAGVIHRDLSPDNLMLLSDFSVKVLDLGAAKDTTVSSFTSSVRVAKGGFSPPEQYFQRGCSGTWTDVYSMSATIYYCLTGQIPPTAVDRMDKDLMRWDLPQLKDLPKHVLRALQNAMTLDYHKRTPNMEAFVLGLTEHIKSDSWKKILAGGLVAVAALTLAFTIREASTFLAHKKDTRKPSVSVSVTQTTPVITPPEVTPPKETAPQPAETAPAETTVPETTAPPAATLTQQCQTFSAGRRHSVALMSDGTVTAQGYAGNGQCSVQDWRNITSVVAGCLHTVGLKADGTVLATGYNDDGQCNVSSWTDIVAISAGQHHTVGLKKDGTVVAVGSNTYGQCDVRNWTDIVAISAGWNHTVGLKSDGTVVATGDYIKVGSWTDIVALSSGYNFTVGLKADGTVVSAGHNDKGQRDVSGWRNIVAIATGYDHTVGLKADGTVVSVGSECEKDGLRDTRSLSDIVAIAAGSHHIVAMKKDGSFVALGDNDLGQCNVTGWKNIPIPDNYHPL